MQFACLKKKCSVIFEMKKYPCSQWKDVEKSECSAGIMEGRKEPKHAVGDDGSTAPTAKRGNWAATDGNGNSSGSCGGILRSGRQPLCGARHTLACCTCIFIAQGVAQWGADGTGLHYWALPFLPLLLLLLLLLVLTLLFLLVPVLILVVALVIILNNSLLGRQCALVLLRLLRLLHRRGLAVELCGIDKIGNIVAVLIILPLVLSACFPRSALVLGLAGGPKTLLLDGILTELTDQGGFLCFF